MTTLAPLNSVTWTNFSDPSLTSTQITDLKNAVNNEADIKAALSAVASSVPSGPFASGAVSLPSRSNTSINGGTVLQDLNAALIIAKANLGKVVQYFSNGTVLNVVANSASSFSYPSASTVASYARSAFYNNGTTPSYYAFFNSEAAATVAIQNAPVNSAFSFTSQPSGIVNFVVKDAKGVISTCSPTASSDSLATKGYTNILTSATNPNAKAAGISLNDLVSAASAISSKVTVGAINNLLGTTYTGTDSLTTAQVNTLVNSINNDNSLLLASRLPVEDGGGVKYHNGQWYLNGNVTNFFNVYLRVRVNQLVNIDTATTDYINNIQKRNNLITQANYFLSQINAAMPTTTDGTTSYTAIASNSGVDKTSINAVFSAKYGFNPFAKFMPVAWAKLNVDSSGNLWGGSFNQTTMETWSTEVKSLISSKQTENTSDQTQLQTLTDKRTEIIDAVTNTTKANGQVGASIGRNMT